VSTLPPELPVSFGGMQAMATAALVAKRHPSLVENAAVAPSIETINRLAIPYDKAGKVSLSEHVQAAFARVIPQATLDAFMRFAGSSPRAEVPSGAVPALEMASRLASPALQAR
jgi:hypothetical protein